jgi:hypothetical protein
MTGKTVTDLLRSIAENSEEQLRLARENQRSFQDARRQQRVYLRMSFVSAVVFLVAFLILVSIQ